MTLGPFDGSVYRKTVLTSLRAAAPAAVDDVFWLGHVPPETDDAALIVARLKETRAFLHKERSRPRQADVAAAVLKEWGRIEHTLADPGARRALRARLATDPAGARGGARDASAVPARAAGGTGAASAEDPAARRRAQVARALGELARLRDDPELAEDLFAFLGLPFTATSPMISSRLEQIGEVNRRRRADRERSLVDELLMHGRELLVEGEPAAYRAGLEADANPEAASAVPSPTVPVPTTSAATPTPSGPAPDPTPSVPTPATEAASEEAASAARSKISWARPSKPPPPPGPTSTPPAPASAPAASPPSAPSAPLEPVAPPVDDVLARRESDDTVVVTWAWPFGITEAFVSVGAGSHPAAGGPGGRKVTNVKYELDGGARLHGVPEATLVRVHTGRRDASGTLVWNPAELARGTIAA